MARPILGGVFLNLQFIPHYIEESEESDSEESKEEKIDSKEKKKISQVTKEKEISLIEGRSQLEISSTKEKEISSTGEKNISSIQESTPLTSFENPKEIVPSQDKIKVASSQGNNKRKREEEDGSENSKVGSFFRISIFIALLSMFLVYFWIR